VSASIVLYDACVLYPAPLRDLLLRVAEAGLVQAKWSDRILDEAFDAILRDRPDLDRARLQRPRSMMNKAIPDCLVTGFEELPGDVLLPDPDDRHVLAAAIHSGARAIVTANVRDFPDEALSPFEMEAVHPDQFVLGLVGLAPGVVLRVLEEQAAALKSPPVTLADLLDTLEKNGLVRSVAESRRLFKLPG